MTTWFYCTTCGYTDEDLNSAEEWRSGMACPSCGCGPIRPVDEPKSPACPIRHYFDTDALVVRTVELLSAGERLSWVQDPSVRNAYQISSDWLVEDPDKAVGRVRAELAKELSAAARARKRADDRFHAVDKILRGLA